MKNTIEMDLTEGPLFKKIIIFTIPVILTGMLQFLYNAADLIVVGNFASSLSLAAVGSTSSLINLIINVLVGFSIGAAVIVGNRYGARDREGLKKAVGTSITVALIGGILCGAVGVIFARRFLIWMSTPDEVLSLATLYLQIYFLGLPANMLYLFGASILRSVGDTRHPLVFLSLAGVVNVGLNLVLVIVFQMDVAGVAIATIASQFLSAFLVLRLLMTRDSLVRFSFADLKIDRSSFWTILKIGFPAGLQGTIFSISNVIIQTAVNGFGDTVISGVAVSSANVVAGNSAASSIEGFVYIAMNAVYQTSLAFTSQNYGSGKIKNLSRIMAYCLAFVFLIGLVLGVTTTLFGRTIVGLYSRDPEVIVTGAFRLRYVSLPYALCGMMDTMVGCLRGVGKSILPMVSSLIGVCGVRLGWIFLVFSTHHTLDMLYICYPISWLAALIFHFVSYGLILHRLENPSPARPSEERTAPHE